MMSSSGIDLGKGSPNTRVSVIAQEPIPRELLTKIEKETKQWISDHFTAIYARNLENQREAPSLLGSATFVQYGNRKGLLTAQHLTVSAPWRSCKSVGFVARNYPHDASIPKDRLRVSATIPESAEYGPDIAFVQVPEEDASTIAAHRSFWQMDSNRERALRVLSPTSEGLWVLCGCPPSYQERTTRGPHFDDLLVQRPLTMVSRRVRYCEKHVYDYCGIEVYFGDDDDLPKSFGGVSGGGLLFIPLSKGVDKTELIHVHRPMLMGVAFYETDIENDRRIIRCHGPKSIYMKFQPILDSD